jgi:hypothetical protein
MDIPSMSNHDLCRKFPGKKLALIGRNSLNDKGNRIMSSINGNYVNANAGAKLTITDGNDSNGTFSGKFSQNGVNYDIAYGHYHFQNSTGQPTVITFAALNEGSGYQAWTLFSPDHNYAKVRAVGARNNFDGDVAGLAGEFVKQ